MGVYQILGGRRLCGTVTVQGSKNAVLPMIAAAVLTKEEGVLEGCPKISEVEDCKKPWRNSLVGEECASHEL